MLEDLLKEKQNGAIRMENGGVHPLQEWRRVKLG
jgi:hypothetical protein